MISINLTIHNKGFLIDRVLESIKKFTTSDYEIVCVLDGCSDSSEAKVDLFFEKNKNIPFKKIILDNMFETKSNNAAAKASDGDYIVIVQDDTIVNELSWDERLIKPMSVFDDIFAVTANTSHNWRLNKDSRDIYSMQERDDSWSDILIHFDHANKTTLDRSVFGVRDCVNRGPLAIDKAILKSLNYLDEEFCPQDSDDHDLCFRAYKTFGLRCGAFPIDFICDPTWGGTRENGVTKKWMYAANNKNTRLLFKRHGARMLKGPIGNENRIIE